MSRPIGERRICLRCGELLPVDCSISRKYCDECAKQRNIELTIRRQQAAREYYERKRAESEGAADRAYCQKCIYHGSAAYGGNLCDYILITKKRRGCMAGKGCKKRKLIPSEAPKTGERICQRCGSAYIGGGKSRYCPECRKEASRKNAIHAAAMRRTADGSGKK